MNKLSPERIGELKEFIQGVDRSSGGYHRRDINDLLTILNAYGHGVQIEKNTGMGESANVGEAPCKSGEAVADEERREMLEYMGMVWSWCPYGHLKKEMDDKIRALILSPTKTVSREWFERLEDNLYWAGETESKENRDEAIKMLRDLGIIVEPEKE